jgi:hypothetical protein
MINRKLILLISLSILWLGACHLAEPKRAAQWTYRPINSQQRELTIRLPNFVSVGHLGIDAFLCPDDSPLSCFRASGLSFAVPKTLSDDIKSWEENGITYKVTAHRAEVFFGQLFDAYFIESKEGDSAREFMFSPARGLLSIRINDGVVTTQLILIDYCGFGASVSCRPQ